MKHMKKMMALVIAMVMVLAMSLPVFAEDPTYSITVTNTNDSITIAGKTYSAYKLFDMTYNTDKTAYSYKIDSDGDGAWAWDTIKGTADANGVYTNSTYGLTFTPSAADPTVYSVTSTMTDAQARDLADALESHKPSTNNGTATVATGAETCTINTNPNAAGYYLVYGTAASADPDDEDGDIVAAVALTSTNPTATVNPKASIPTLDKKIKKVQEGSTDQTGAVLDEAGQAAVAKIGSKVTYEITATTPDLTGYDDYTFIIGDSITAGLDYDKTSFALTIDGDEADFVTSATAAKTDNELIFASGDKSFTLTIPYSVLSAAGAGKNVVLTYSCTVNSSALTTDYENNTANLEYSRSPYDNNTNHTPDKKTYVIDLNLDVDKIAEGSTATKLDGATFKLYKTAAGAATYAEATEYAAGTTYYSDNDGTDTVVEIADADAFAAFEGTLYTKTVGEDSKLYYKWADNKVTWVEGQANGDAFTTDTTGNLTQQVRGLDKGTYYLEETVAPEGYNLLAEPVTVVITATEASNKVTYTATYGGQAATMTNGQVDLTAVQNSNQPVATGVIENNAGSVLPSTGGICTTIFYIFGAILVIGAGVLLVTRRRMNAN